jgi:ribosomal protein S18 acetylase RimI-like enzyme
MQDITIYKVSLQDVEALQAIGRVTFSQTFSEHNNAEDMEAYLKTSYAIEKLTAEINNPESEFYFAKENENIIGYLKINTGKAQTEIKNLDAFEIERIYVDQAYLGKKIGQILFQKALQLAKQKKAAYVWLGVWEENNRAIAFYKKNGFVPFDKHIFKLGNDEQTDIMMKLDLSF